MTANRYYRPGPDRSSQVRALFDRIAPRYDLINDLQSFGLHRYWKRRLIALASPGSRTRVLDVCCGSGDLAHALASRGAAVVGCDFSGAMLAVARARSAGKIQFVQADALALPARDGSFEVVTIGYGLRNLADLDGGVRELLRVLKPGGRLLILDFGKPRNPVWRALYFAYLRLCVPVFGLLFCRDSAAYGYILESLVHYPAQDGVSEVLLKHGCSEVEAHNLLGGMMSIHQAVKPPSFREGDDVPLVSRHLLSER